MNDHTSSALYAFRTFSDTVIRTAYAFCGNYAEAEDITQEVFLSLHAEPRSFSSDEHLKAWLIRCTINRCINYKKSGRVRFTQPLSDSDDTLLSCGAPDTGSILENVTALPEKYRSVIYLYYYEGYKIHEIAEMTNRSENTVSSLLRRGRQKLKLELEKEGNHEA